MRDSRRFRYAFPAGADGASTPRRGDCLHRPEAFRRHPHPHRKPRRSAMNKFALVLKSLLLSLVLSFSAFAAGPVNINTADAATLATSLQGVGPAKARAIVEYRQTHGAFKSADQLAA